MRQRAVLFDLGGTLLDYAGGYDVWPDMEGPGLAAAYETLRQKPLRLPPMESFRRLGYHHLPLRWQAATRGEQNLTVPSLLAGIIASLGVDGVEEAWVEEAAAAYETTISTRSTPMPHVAAMLQAVQAAGYKVGLLSNTMFRGRVHLDDLSRFELGHYFDAWLFSGDVNMWKPHATPFHALLQQLEVAPEQAVYVGDDPANDVVGGQNAGMLTVHYQSHPRFATPEGVRPHATIHSLNQLADVLTQLSWGR